MRIAFLTTEFVTEPQFSGGLANYLLRTCLSLMELGHSPTVFVISEKANAFLYRSIQVHQIKYSPPPILKSIDGITFKKFTRFLWMIGSARTIAKALNIENRKTPFDIVQSTSYKGTSLFVNPNIPSVVRISGIQQLLREAYGKPSNFVEKMVEWLELVAIKRAQGVYAPSKLIADRLGLVLGQHIKVIQPPFFLDTQNLDWTLYENALRKKSYLLFFGTIGLLKGCKTIAQILEPVLLSNPGLYFVFVGKSTKYNGLPMMEYILQKARSVRRRVLHFESMHHEALYPIIKNARAVILPSRIDNFPNTCLEAMHFGQIVVGTLGTSFEELIDDGVSGFLCVPDDPESLLKVTQKALSLSNPQREIISKNAKNRIAALRPQNIIPGLIQFYKSVIYEKFSFQPGK
jgi:glycogen(starch) synthase